MTIKLRPRTEPKLQCDESPPEGAETPRPRRFVNAGCSESVVHSPLRVVRPGLPRDRPKPSSGLSLWRALRPPGPCLPPSPEASAPPGAPPGRSAAPPPPASRSGSASPWPAPLLSSGDLGEGWDSGELARVRRRASEGGWRRTLTLHGHPLPQLLLQATLPVLQLQLSGAGGQKEQRVHLFSCEEQQKHLLQQMKKKMNNGSDF